MPSSVIGSIAASVGGSLLSSAIGGSASGAQSDAAGQAAATQKYMYDTSRSDLAPYRASGEAANARLSYLMGLTPAAAPAGPAASGTSAGTVLTPQQAIAQLGYNGVQGGGAVQRWLDANPSIKAQYTALTTGKPIASATPAAATPNNDPAFGSLSRKFGMTDYTADPGYQFRLDQGNKGLDRAGAARGSFYSGRALKDAVDYNSGMASQEYGNAYNRFNTDQGNLYSRLGGIVGTGTGATNTAVTANQNNANEMGSIYAAQGQNAANAAINQGNIFSQGLSGMLGGGKSSYNMGASSFYNPGTFNSSAFASGLPWSDARLKTDITHLGHEKGIPVYSFRYRADPERVLYRGVLAQDVAHIAGAVVMDGDYMRVNYNALGIEPGRMH